MNRLDQFGKKVGLKIKLENTKVLRYNSRRQNPLVIGEREVDDVKSCVYVGSKADKLGDTAHDKKA